MALINKLNAVGDAIRAKTGKTDLLTLDDMVTEIAAIETGGGGGDLPEEAFIITGNCTYRFAFNGWNWFIENYGNKITTVDIDTVLYMFNTAQSLTSIPFDINCKDNTEIDFDAVFSNCNRLKVLPLVKANPPVATSTYGYSSYTNLFSSCYRLREIPNDFFWNLGSEEYWAKEQTLKGGRNNLFTHCKSLRKLPDISMLKSTVSVYSNLYYYMFYGCNALDEVVDLPVLDGVTFTSNAFNNTFADCSRLKKITFKTNDDGTAIAVSWKSQTIDLSKTVGYCDAACKAGVVGYNSGITEDTWIIDDATYQALKDNEDAFTADNAYSRYNHDSAVETINSLPDTSAYLAANSGTNTIKFKGTAGSSTDGGAINTLTEEEIAVAAAKGWTVTLA